MQNRRQLQQSRTCNQSIVSTIQAACSVSETYLVPALCLLQQYNLSWAGHTNGLPEQWHIEGFWDLAADIPRHISNESLPADTRARCAHSWLQVHLHIVANNVGLMFSYMILLYFRV